MDPSNTNQVPAMELPNVSTEAQQGMPEQSQVLPTTETGTAQALEQGISQTPPTDPAAFDMNLGPQPAVATTFDPSQVAPMQPVQSTSLSMPSIADDNDLIEKEWVAKAKQIVEHTQADPHLQNKEMTKMKIEYLKKRYNKEVKLIEE